MLDTDQHYASKAAYECAITLLALALSIARLFFSVLVTMHLWNWFVPVALGLPALTYWLAFGLSLVYQSLRGFKRQDVAIKSTPEQDIKYGLGLWLCWILPLAIGYLVHLAA
jgi:uncharacterized membrane protein